ncbi:MAG TPA: RNA polymerase sigma factor [Thermoanaerobaculia bacterium]|nr:RNA polymerase sigma factor [Thermoanaerobaculia bacterium]
MPPERMLQAATIQGATPVTVVRDDHRLASACAAGDSKVFEEIYRRYGDRMKSIAFNHLGTTADAEDAVQETFLKIHRAASTYTGEASFATWIFRILVNTCYDLLRKRRRRIEEAPIDDTFDSIKRSAATVDDAKRMTLRKMLDELPEQRRSVFMLFEIEGLSHAEIGEVLGISEGNSKWILFATKKELQEKWKKR